MKKLMIAMGAAAMMSLCAQAAVPGAGADTAYGKSLGTGTDFENYDGAFDIEADDFGGDTYARYWAQRAVGVTGESALITTNSNTYLKVEETDELTRLIDVDQGAVAPQTVVGDGGSSIYFSSQVQFTAADDEPAVSNGVDKIIVWAKAPKDDPGEGDPTTTNLMVTALNPDTALPDVYDTGITVDAESWYDLVIVASPTPGDDPVSPISFTVKLGNNTAPRTYLSMVRSGADRGTISSASFKGTGAVDDIDWGTVAAAEPVEVTLSVGAGVTLYEYSSEMEPVDYSSFNGVPGSTRQFLVAGNALDYTVTNATITDGEGDYAGLAVITITVEENLTVTISAGSAPQPVAVDFTVIPEGVTVDGLGSAYYVGDKINPSLLSATSSDPTKRAVVTVKVNDSVITGEYTLQAKDVLVVEVTEEYITFALTLPNVANATPTVTSNDVVVADISAIVTGTVVTVTWTPAEGYKITSGTTEEITMSENKTATAPTVVAITYATLTITPVANCTITVMNGETAVESGAKFDVADQVQLTVTRTPAQGYQLDNCAAEETITMSEDRTVTAAVVQSSGDFVPNYIAGKSQETVAKYKAWASKYGDDTQSANEDAYLLNCHPSEVAAAKAAFKFTSITPGQIPTISGENYNGVVVILGGTSLSDIANWDKATTSDTFFKATLVVEETAPAQD